MEHRVDYSKAAPGVLHSMLNTEKYLAQSGLDSKLRDLVHLWMGLLGALAHEDRMRGAIGRARRLVLVI